MWVFELPVCNIHMDLMVYYHLSTVGGVSLLGVCVVKTVYCGAREILQPLRTWWDIFISFTRFASVNRLVFSFCMFIFLYCIYIEFLYVYFPVLLCLSVSVKWLAVKTASEMSYIVSGGALNSTHSLTFGLSVRKCVRASMWPGVRAGCIWAYTSKSLLAWYQWMEFHQTLGLMMQFRQQIIWLGFEARESKSRSLWGQVWKKLWSCVSWMAWSITTNFDYIVAYDAYQHSQMFYIIK